MKRFNRISQNVHQTQIIPLFCACLRVNSPLVYVISCISWKNHGIPDGSAAAWNFCNETNTHKLFDGVHLKWFRERKILPFCCFRKCIIGFFDTFYFLPSGANKIHSFYVRLTRQKFVEFVSNESNMYAVFWIAFIIYDINHMLINIFDRRFIMSNSAEHWLYSMRSMLRLTQIRGLLGLFSPSNHMQMISKCHYERIAVSVCAPCIIISG